MEIRLLGPVELLTERGPVPIGSAKQRALLAFMALNPQRLLTYDALIDGLWGDAPPDATVEALRFHVSRLRGILREVDGADRLRTRPRGYQLVLDEEAVDALRFERFIAGARLARSEGAAPDAVSRAFRDGLDLWVGTALADINGEPFVVGERRRLEELRLAATEDYFAAELAVGRHSEAVGELERMVDRHPLRERLWELLITALYRSGRQADALAAYQRVRRILADELGIEPSPTLRALEHRVLVQDTGLARPEASRAAPWHANGEEPSTAPADVRPAFVPATGPPRRRALATAALALSVLALVLFWRGFVSTLIAALGVVCGTIARRSRTAEAPAARRATVAVITGVVAFSASLGLVVYRYAAPDGETADPTESSDDRETPDTSDTTEAPDDRETGNQTQVSNDFTVHDDLTPLQDLGAGDCIINLSVAPPPAASISQTLATSGATVSRVPCDQPHEREVYHLFEFPAGPYPGDEQLQAQALDMCSVQFQNYVGVSPAESALEFSYIWPDQPYWQQGFRGGGCALYDPSGLDLTGSMRGSQR
jgi:DNA-binding SARP family transcriptional activator